MTAAQQPAAPEPAWDSVRPARGSQVALVIFGFLFAIPSTVFTVLRIWQPSGQSVALLTSFISYAIIGHLVALLFFLIALIRARKRLLLAVITILVAIMLALHGSWLGPLFVPDGRPATTSEFRVLSVNVLGGAADARRLDEAAGDADLVVLLEFEPDAMEELDRLGWSERFPHQVGADERGVNGSAVFSRFPLSDSELLPQTTFQQWMATAEVPEVGPVRVIGVHPCNPYCGMSRFQSEHRLIRRIAAEQPADQPLIVAGDFNAVDDHRAMQELRSDGLRSATDVAGAGWQPTFPAGRRFPALIPIDHVLINDRLTATQVGTVAIPGTDHLGILATLAGTS
ncbi:endonuclease/exonuclease/phosphatase family protein [Microlunatus speluncae]|uniref:endonuclease/exonuclease/phosphatase family protein n=1 Tax=Microlunatus speluncae TaxID=2594267 RepID=UPI0012668367|nr:endonuclease/exonuclease/phosphatase family protein [Microlunatus speluncae]